jgi:hypothetical protein
MDKFWLVYDAQTADTYKHPTHAAAVLFAQERANRKPGRKFIIGEFKELWCVPVVPPPPAEQTLLIEADFPVEAEAVPEAIDDWADPDAP